MFLEKEEQEQLSLNNLQDSDTMEEQHSIPELDSQMVNMIVAGGGVRYYLLFDFYRWTKTINNIVWVKIIVDCIVPFIV